MQALKKFSKSAAAYMNTSSGGGLSSVLGPSVGKALGPALVGAGVYAAGKLVQEGRKFMAASPQGFQRMIQEAGPEFVNLSPEDKMKAQKYYYAIAQHSPTVANDPIAAWNHVAHFIRHPSTYQPTAIEQLRKVESSGADIKLGK